MATNDLLGTEPTHDTADDPTRRLYRVAGLGGIGAFLAWVCQPILVSVLAASDAPDSPTWEDIEATRWNGSIEVLIFSGLGIGTLFFVLATWQLVRLRSGASSVAQQVGLVGGLVAAVSWFLVAAESFRIYTSIGAGLPDITDDPELQQIALEGTFLDITGGLVWFTVGFTLWTVLLATAARRAGVIGPALAAFAALTLLAPLAGLGMPFGAPWWMVAYVLSMLVFGISFLVKARR